MTADIGITSTVLSSILIRSIRELLFNVVKHSGVSSASLACGIDEGLLLITVRDAGHGCHPSDLKVKQNRGDVFGLFNIEDRIKVLGGRVAITSIPGREFCVTISIPTDISLPPDRRPTLPDDPLRLPSDPGASPSAAANAPPTSPTRVMLVDDHELLRAGLATLLQDQTGIVVAGTAADGRQAIEKALQLKPDVILMDISMPVMDGIKATARIRELLPDTRVIGLTIHKDPETLQAMRDAGAWACLSKTGSPEALIQQIRKCAV
jgi:CheY-like chemotaxis protein